MKEIGKIIEYLESNKNSFIDEMMVQVAEMRDSVIFQEMGKACINIGVYVDEKRLKKWIEMCVELEHIPPHIRIHLGIQAETARLNARIEQLEIENAELKETIANLQNEHEDYWDTVDDWE
jgi:hypothetical protein